MPRRTPRRKPGRPTRLTTELADRITEIIQNGNHQATACAQVGVSPAAYYHWLTRGQDATTAHANGEPIDLDTERVYMEFADAVARARARAEVRAVRVVDRSMQGGFVVSEEPVVDVDGVVQRGDDGEVLWKRSYSQPDGRLALEYLSRSRPEAWGRRQAQRVEVTGPAGGAVQVEHSVVIASLAERLSAVVAERAADRELEAGGGDVVDGEVEGEADDDGV